MRRRKTTWLQVRISPEERREIERGARKMGLSMSECVRRLAIGGIRYLRYREQCNGKERPLSAFLALSSGNSYEDTLRVLGE